MELPRINVKKLVEDIKALEEKQTHIKREVKPVWARFDQAISNWYFRRKEGSHIDKPVRPEIDRPGDYSSRLTKLYSLRAAIHGKLHMTRKRIDYIQSWVKEENILDPVKFIVRWTEEDQMRLIEDIIEEYQVDKPEKKIIGANLVAKVVSYITN